MAQRRMFSLKVIDTDAFLDMSPTAQLLYFHLAMRADDDGFVASPKKIMKMANGADDDMKVLIIKKYIIPFENGVCVIRDWKIHNYIQTDRYSETEYREEKQKLIENNGKYDLKDKCIQNGYNMDTQVRLGKVRLGKDMGIVASSDTPFSLKEELEKMKKDPKRHIQLIGEYLEEKKIPIASKKELQIAISRHCKDAVELSAFDDSRIGWATGVAEKEYKDYTLRTLIKILTR